MNAKVNVTCEEFLRMCHVTLPHKTNTVMNITSAKISFSRIGVHTANGSSAIYMPRVTLNLEGRKTSKSGYFDIGRFSKKDYLGLALCPACVVILTASEYIFVWDDAKEHACAAREDLGRIVGMDEEGPIMLKGEELRWYDKNAECIFHRPMDEKEAEMLKENK